jgi:hypothetical protein
MGADGYGYGNGGLNQRLCFALIVVLIVDYASMDAD